MNPADVDQARTSPAPVGAAGRGVAAGPAQEPYAARAVGLRKLYGKVAAVDGIDLEVPEGAVLGMLGPNGSGKTTLIRLLLGLTRPTAGSAELLGAPVPDAGALAQVGALVEGPGFHPFLSGRENLRRAAAFEPLLAGPAIPGAVDRALERVGLAGAAERRYRGYSLGMKQRLGLAAALLVPRRLVVLDEPTNGLDPAGTRDVRGIIAELHAGGATVIVSSHLLAEIEATCTHVAVLQAGSLVAAGELAGLLDARTGGLVVTTPDVELALTTLREAGAVAAALTGPEPGIVVTDGPALSAASAGGSASAVPSAASAGKSASAVPSAASAGKSASAVPSAASAGKSASAGSPEIIALLVRAGVAVHEARRRRPRLEELFAQLTEEPPA